MASGNEDLKKNWQQYSSTGSSSSAAGRRGRNLPMSPTSFMMVGGVLVAAAIGYFMFYDKNKNKGSPSGGRDFTAGAGGRRFAENNSTPQPPQPRS